MTVNTNDSFIYKIIVEESNGLNMTFYNKFGVLNFWVFKLFFYK